jgi:PPK2 family polyphosphate:nucleotide phosphotransferase
MTQATPSPHLVATDGSFRISHCSTVPPDGGPTKETLRQRLDESTDRLEDLQRMLYAQDEHALLLVFQAMDAAGKDGTIRAIMDGVNPAGCQVASFKQPSAEELDHDFLWRTTRRLPERGRIGIFNRSYYEEVLVVRVHPEYLGAQRLPSPPPLDTLWEERFDSIRDHERHLARNGTTIVKFFLHVSREEQRRRFLERLNEPHKHWKFSVGDVEERTHWDAYQEAYGSALAATSRPWAPWYAIPADDKHDMRTAVADIVFRTLERMDLAFPEVDAETRTRFDEMREILGGE